MWADRDYKKHGFAPLSRPRDATREFACRKWQPEARNFLTPLAMLTTLAPTLALHASPLPSSLQTALDPAYPVPLRSSACYEDALLAEERARNGSTQLRCSAPVEAPPDGVRYEKATFPVFIPKCECERVMREIRAYCKAEEPLGDLNLDKRADLVIGNKFYINSNPEIATTLPRFSGSGST